jgi:hypothetical protein
MEELLIFYLGALTGGITSQQRMPDGTWSGEVSLGTEAETITAAMVPGSNMLQLFYRRGGGVLSRWINLDGTWSGEQALGDHIDGGGIAAARLPGTDVLQLFYHQSGAIWSMWRNSDGTWSGEHNLGGHPAPGATITAAQVPNTDIVQLFYSGTDGSVRTQWGIPPIGPGTADGSLPGYPAPGGTITPAPVPGSNILQIFYIGTNGQIHTIWRPPPNGPWTTTEQILGGHPAHGVDITAAQVPGTDILQIFYIGVDYTICSMQRNPPNGQWTGELSLHGQANGESIVAGLYVPPTTPI